MYEHGGVDLRWDYMEHKHCEWSFNFTWARGRQGLVFGAKGLGRYHVCYMHYRDSGASSFVGMYVRYVHIC